MLAAPMAADDLFDLVGMIEVTAPGLLVNDLDPDGDPLSLEVIPEVAPQFGVLELFTDGGFRYTHDGSGNLSDEFVYRVVDTEGLADTATVTLDITLPNSPPVADVNVPLMATVGEAFQVDASASTDPDNDPLTYGWDIDLDGIADFETNMAVDLIPWSLLDSLGITPGQHFVDLIVSDGALSDTFRAPYDVMGTWEFETGIVDNVTLIRDGTDYALLDSDNIADVLDTAPVALVTDISIIGSATDNTLTVDYSAGSPIPPLGVAFFGDGQAISDTLRIVGGSSNQVEYEFSSVDTGSLSTDHGTILFENVELARDELDALNRSFAFGGNAETVTLNDELGNNGFSRIDSTDAPAIAFHNPTDLLQINAGEGADTIIVDGADAALEAFLGIVGGGGVDQLQWNQQPGTIDSLQVTSETAVIAATNVTTTQSQNWNTVIQIAADTSFAGGDLQFIQTIDDDSNVATNSRLSMSSTGTVAFAQSVGSLAPLSELSISASRVDNLAAEIVTSGPQLFEATFVLLNDTEITSDGATFQGLVEGPSGIVVTSAGDTVFGAAMGSTTALTSLRSNGTGRTRISGPTVNALDTLDFADAVTIAADTTFTANDLTFRSTLDGPGGITANILNVTQFIGDVGVIEPLNSLQTDADGTTVLTSPSLIVANGVEVFDATTVEANPLRLTASDLRFGSTLNGPGSLLATISTATRLDGSVVIPGLQIEGLGDTFISANQILADEVEFAGPVFIEIPSATITGDRLVFRSTLDGPGGLDARQSILTRFGGDVGRDSKLAFLTTSAAGQTELEGEVVQADGDLNFANAVAVALDTSFMADNLTFVSTLDGPGGVTANVPNETRFMGNVGTMQALNSLTTDMTGMTFFGASQVVVSSRVDVLDSAILQANPTRLTASDLTFQSTLDGPGSLRANVSGATQLIGRVGSSNNIPSLQFEGAGNVRIATDQIVADEVVFTGAVSIESTTTAITGDSLLFGSTLDGSGGLDARQSNLTRFEGDVGGLVPLASLTTSRGGPTHIASGLVQASGNIGFDNAVVLEADVTVGGASVAFQNLNGPRGVTINASQDTVLAGPVGTTVAVDFLTTDALGQTLIETTPVVANNAVQLADPVVLRAPTRIQASDVTFRQEIDAEAINPLPTLRIDASADASLQMSVGAGTRPTSGLVLSSDGLGSLFVAGTRIRLASDTSGEINLQTTGEQRYAGPALLLDDVQLQSNTANVLFENEVDASDNGASGSPAGLTLRRVQTADSVVFFGPVGADRQDDGDFDSDDAGLAFIDITSIGAFSFSDTLTGSADITVAGDLQVITVDRGAMNDNIQVDTDVEARSTGSILLRAGDDLILQEDARLIADQQVILEGDFDSADDFGGSVVTLGNTGQIAGDHGISILGNEDNDVFQLRETRFGQATPVFIDGGDNRGDLMRDISSGAHVVNRDSGLADAAPFDRNSILEINSTTQLVQDLRMAPIGDRVQWDGRGNPAAADYGFTSANLSRGGQTLLDYQNIEEFGLRSGAGNDRLVIHFPDGLASLPDVITFDAGPGVDRMTAIGSPGDDSITIGDVGTQVSPRQPIEVAQVESLVLSGGDGNDVLVNNTKVSVILASSLQVFGVPSQLDGQAGNDVLVGSDNTDSLFGGPGIDAMFARDGDDALFADIAADGTESFADGDLIDGGANETSFGDRADQAGSGDFVRDVESLIDGGAEKNVLTWLHATLTRRTPEQVESLRATAASAFAARSLQLITTPAAPSIGTYVRAADVNGDGLISPLDALLVVNALEAGIFDPALAGRSLDVNSDGLIAPIDILEVLNVLVVGSNAPLAAAATPRSAMTMTLATCASIVPTEASAAEALQPMLGMDRPKHPQRQRKIRNGDQAVETQAELVDGLFATWSLAGAF